MNFHSYFIKERKNTLREREREDTRKDTVKERERNGGTARKRGRENKIERTKRNIRTVI